MNNTVISITPVNLLGKTGVNLIIHAVDYQLNSTVVTILFKILDSNNIAICNGSRTITDISDWGTDDMVLINKLLTTLGLSLAQ
jgi:hypothetical protein